MKAHDDIHLDRYRPAIFFRRVKAPSAHRFYGFLTGLVGAMGGLGGFFPPLALGFIKQQTGSFLWGFVLLGCFALICLLVAALTTKSHSKQQIARVA